MLAFCAVHAHGVAMVPPRVNLGSEVFQPVPGKFEIDDDVRYAMPITFGGRTPEPTPAIEYPSVQDRLFRYATEESLLLPLIPKQLALVEPTVTVRLSQYLHVPWLTGRNYSSVSVTVPVMYTSPDGGVLEGDFDMVSFDNSAESQSLYREAIGQPRVFANISVDVGAGGVETAHVWYDQGPNGLTEFLTLSVNPTLAPARSDPVNGTEHRLSWRYLPSSLGSDVAPSINELVHLPVDVVSDVSAWVEGCSLLWTKPAADPASKEPAPGWNKMPTEWRYVNALGDLPVRQVKCGVSRRTESHRTDLAEVLYDVLHPTALRDSAPHPQGTFDPSQGNVDYRMPITFGGWPASGGGVAHYPSSDSLWMAYTTDPEALLPLIPSGLVLTSPTVVVSLSKYTNIDWLAGRGYNMINFLANVGYPLSNGSMVYSTLSLVVWEDWSDCLITGREMSGVPKIWADIEFEDGDTKKDVKASWGGVPFLEAHIELGPVEETPGQPRTTGHGFLWKYFPKPGKPGQGQVSELTDYPSDSRAIAHANGTSCSIAWLPGREAGVPVTEEEVPTQFKVLNALASLPVHDVFCGFDVSEVWLRNDLSNVIAPNFGLREAAAAVWV